MQCSDEAEVVGSVVAAEHARYLAAAAAAAATGSSALSVLMPRFICSTIITMASYLSRSTGGPSMNFHLPAGRGEVGWGGGGKRGLWPRAGSLAAPRPHPA